STFSPAWATDSRRGKPRNPQVPLMVWTSRKMLLSNAGSLGFCSSFTSSTSSTEMLSLASVKNSLRRSSMAIPGQKRSSMTAAHRHGRPVDTTCGKWIKKRLRHGVLCRAFFVGPSLSGCRRRPLRPGCEPELTGLRFAQGDGNTERLGEARGKISLNRTRGQIGKPGLARERGTYLAGQVDRLADTDYLDAARRRRSCGDGDGSAARQRLGRQHDHVARQLLPFGGQCQRLGLPRAAQLAAIEQTADELVRVRAGGLAGGRRAIGESIELQTLPGLPGALLDQGRRITDKIRIILAEELDPVGDGADRAYQLVAQTCREQFQYP